MTKPRIAVAMLGARMHYAVPRILHRAGLLERLYTDSYIGNKPVLGAILARLPQRLKRGGIGRWLGRDAASLPPAKVTSFERLGLYYALARRRMRDDAATEAVYEATNVRFNEAVLAHGLGAADAIFGYNTASLELFRAARAAGKRCILEQTILPKQIERQLLREVMAEWPDWAKPEDLLHDHPATCRREAEEWALADLILAGSRFVADGLVACGVAPEKVHVVPYGVDGAQFGPAPGRALSGSPLRVLFVGEVGLRKGAPYLLEALAALGPGLVEAKFVGTVAAPAASLDRYRAVAAFTGRLPRGEMQALYRWADVFVLPSIVEGSATVTYEALMCGLPMIVTPNTGSIIEPGVEGFVVPTRDSDALATALRAYCDDRALLARHARAALAARPRAGLERYGRDLETLLR